MQHPFSPERYVGSVYRVDAGSVDITLPSAGRRALTHHGERLSRGEVGEFLVIDVGGLGIFGRLSEVWLPATEREMAEAGPDTDSAMHPVGRVQLLSTLNLTGAHVRGIVRYPRIGDAAYAASAEVLSTLISDNPVAPPEYSPPVVRMGVLASHSQVEVSLDARRLFGRHLAVLGATGSGKSWTLAHLVEEVSRVGGKILLIDATGEFFTLGNLADHIALGTGADRPSNITRASLPHQTMSESDLNAFLRPSSGAQLPKLREAIRSLRLAYALGDHELVNESGCIPKAGRLRKPFFKARREHAAVVEAPDSPFDLRALPAQIQHECIFDTDKQKPERFGSMAGNDVAYCTSLVSRIYDILQTQEVMDVLTATESRPPVFDAIDKFLETKSRHALRISLRSLPFSHHLREIVVNAIGRRLLELARSDAFDARPLVVCVDEAHQFFGQAVGAEETAVRLENFESIAKEGRKYGLTLCMATQRPADLPAGVLSQAGMLMVHRLGDGRDRDRVEQASTDLDRSAAKLLPGLTPGEAVFVGVDFPVPVAVRVHEPKRKPKSEGPKYGTGWKR